MDLRQGDLGLLESDLAGRLLVSTVPAQSLRWELDEADGGCIGGRR